MAEKIPLMQHLDQELYKPPLKNSIRLTEYLKRAKGLVYQGDVAFLDENYEVAYKAYKSLVWMYVHVLCVHVDATTEHFKPKVEEYKEYAYDAMAKLEKTIVPALKGQFYDPSHPSASIGDPDSDDQSPRNGNGGGGGTVLLSDAH